MPDWIRQRKAEQDTKTAQEQARLQEKLAAEIRIKAEGNQFWLDFVNGLQRNADHLPKLGLRGTLSAPLGNPDSEQHCGVQVYLVGPIPKQAHTDMFYRKGDMSIRCNTSKSEAFQLVFCICPDGKNICVLLDSGSHYMNPEGAAQFIVERMVRYINGEES